MTADPTIFYLVHDLNDPAVGRRVRMLRDGGAALVLAGFHRGAPSCEVEGVDATPLGQTFDGDLRQRLLAVLGQALRPWRLMKLARRADAVMARNLEMLLLARIAGLGRAMPLTYECLDIHRSLLGQGLASRLLRGLEGALLRGVDRVIVSSPAFSSDYFGRLPNATQTLRIVENKVYAPHGGPAPVAAEILGGPPWRIGWFGMIRCRQSLAILARLTEALPGRVEVEIRGRPSPAEFEDFAALTTAMPGVTFLGSYEAEDLAALYDGVHFVWGLDFFEEGLNSRWLLPNRLYEGGARDRPIIAQAEVETGRWLARRDCGVLLVAVENDLLRFFEGLTADAYADLAKRSAAVPRRDLIADAQDSRELVSLVTGRRE